MMSQASNGVSGEDVLSVVAKRLFISYAWESEEYRVWVQRLAARFRADGVEARLDYWHLMANDNILEFMSREIRLADWVLVLCSPAYQSKVRAAEEGQSLSGVGWEKRLLTGRMLGGSKNKTLAALTLGSWAESSPEFLAGQVYYDLSNNGSFGRTYRELLQQITGTYQCAPPLGKLPADLRTKPVEPLAASPDEGRSLSVPRAVELPKPEPSPALLFQELQSPPSPEALEEGQLQLERYVKDGYAVYLVAGVSGVGKTEMLLSLQRQQAVLREGTFLAPREGRTGGAMPTAPRSLRCFPMYVRGRKVVLVDASGVHFQRLYPYLRDTAVSAVELGFLQLMTDNLRGVALLIDLRALWQAGSENWAGLLQVEVATWILMLLRWLRYHNGPHDDGLPFELLVDRKLRVMRQRLKVPVLVLFSRADELVGLEVPPIPEGAFRPMQVPKGAPRLLIPALEDPLLLAYHCLPMLFGSLLTHCDHFRFDFIHSLFLDPVTKLVAQRSPCGVRMSLGWLVDADWSWPAVPSRTWIGLQQWLDALSGRGSRWERLPPPRHLADRD
jgi:hypothetical protein